MSDALLTEISKKLSDIHAALKGGASAGGKPTPGAVPDKVAADKATVAAAAAAKVAADKKAATAAAAKATSAAASAPKPAGTKAPGGKHTIEQVREMIRKVAADVGRQDAKDILLDDGGGVEKVLDLKPEKFDAVFEACQVLLKNEGTTAAAVEPEDDLM
jgi:phenylalanyl-tRNA synthetase alpha subunit